MSMRTKVLAAILLLTAWGGWAGTAFADGEATPPPPQPDSVAYPPGLNAGSSVDLTWPVPANTAAPTAAEVIQSVAHNKISINIVWTLVAAFLVMFMQAGFALVETGLCRAKSAAHVMSMNFLIYPLGMLGFWSCGFALMFGGFCNGPVPIGWQPTLGQGLSLLNHEYTVHLFGKAFGLFGHTGFFLNLSVFDTAIFALFIFQMVFMDTTATIPTGAMAERWSFKNFLFYGFWVGMLPYALFGNWVWAAAGWHSSARTSDWGMAMWTSRARPSCICAAA